MNKCFIDKNILLYIHRYSFVLTQRFCLAERTQGAKKNESKEHLSGHPPTSQLQLHCACVAPYGFHGVMRTMSRSSLNSFADFKSICLSLLRTQPSFYEKSVSPAVKYFFNDRSTINAVGQKHSQSTRSSLTLMCGKIPRVTADHVVCSFF